MQSEVTRARNNPDIEGNVPVNVPRQTGRLFVEYAPLFFEGLAVNVGGNYNGDRYVDTVNTDSIDDSITFDAGIRYDYAFARYSVGASCFVNNLTDERYWAYYRSGSGLLAGAPRTVGVSLRASYK